MRSVNQTLRDVKLRRPVHSLQPTRHHTPLPRLVRPVYRHHDALSTPWKRNLATAPATLDLTVLGPSPSPSDRLASRSINPNDISSSLQQSASFGKWQWLSLKPDRLAIESDFSRTGPAKKYSWPLQVDNLENQNDFGLWYCLLDYLQRRHGDEGVYRLWNGMWGRKTLYKTDKASAVVFWQTILETALRYDNEQFLDNIFVYAEWMKKVHNSEWPNLYMGIVSHYLRSHQHNKAIQWHLRLITSFRPPSSEFISLIKQYCTDEVLSESGTLPRLYTTSHERRLYDSVVPYLYAHGCSRLARLWHKTCLRVGDGPTLYAPARPFLRYFAGYFPENLELWSETELAAMSTLDQHSSQQKADDAEDGESEQLEVSREFMNRVHGSTFGFTSKSYNDRLGARWFASSWVSLDTAISVISALGIQKIGPLSLQSIALRDPTPEVVLKRIGHLRDLGILLPDTNYVKSIQYLAKIHDTELLLDLLQCDLHPEVFDDIELHSKLMDSSRASGDIRTYNLLLATRLATFASSSHAFANKMLEISLVIEDHRNIIRVLSDMYYWRISLKPSHVRKLINMMKDNAPLHPFDEDKQHIPHRRSNSLPSPDDARFCQALLWTLRRMDVPIPASVNKQLIISLGRQGKMQLLLPMMRDVINYYTKWRGARPGFIPVSVRDLPQAMTRPLHGVPKLLGVYIPIDTPASRPNHPLTQIFTPWIISSLIRWSFRKIPDGDATAPLLQLQQKRLSRGFEFVRVLSVVRTLKDVGVKIEEENVQKAIILRLAELYGRVEPMKKSTKSVRHRNQLSLAQVKELCDQAWGDEEQPLLPSLEEVQRRIRKLDVYNENRNDELWANVEHRIRRRQVLRRSRPVHHNNVPF
ncbi:hypothetical protein PG985_013914 [Apiospora marii]|uniref:Pentatricopeptide repeat domain-containing protein n=1 Tax=Apiospora marii TaxID=335849 RepID=A0ABR1R6L8_9PEZI